MGTRSFQVILSTRVEIDIDDEVFARIDDEWRSRFYNLRTPEDVAEHLAHNLYRNEAPLNVLDGFADLPVRMARITDSEDQTDSVTETTLPEPKKSTKPGSLRTKK